MTSPIRFGAFEVDTRSGELRRQGLRLKLQEQPFQVLVLLLERPGEVVTREELTKKLWCDNTFVDFDRGLNKAINRLREVLRDSAEKPRFIETLPHRGYRFHTGGVCRPSSDAESRTVTINLRQLRTVFGSSSDAQLVMVGSPKTMLPAKRMCPELTIASTCSLVMSPSIT